MSYRRLAAVLTVIAVVVLAPMIAAAQSPNATTAPRTPWGQPDLQGVWDFAILTPMERPAALAGKETLTDEDVASIVAQSAQLTQFLSERGVAGATGTYDEFWFDFGTDVSADRRTSLVVDPTNGRIPPLTPTAQERMAARRAYLGDHPADSWEDRNIAERCILGFNTGPPMAPSAYNNVFQLFQTPDHVVIFNEMVHDARVVPLDDSAHLPPPTCGSGMGTHAVTGTATHWSSKQSTSPTRRASEAPPTACTWLSASLVPVQTRSTTSSP